MSDHQQIKIPPAFWEMLDDIVNQSQIVIERPKGSTHPRYPEFIYPIDYGYLADTTGSDGDGVDIWMGSLYPGEISGIMCTVDTLDRDVEIKVLLGCTVDEIGIILKIHNQGTQCAFYIPHHKQASCVADKGSLQL